MLMGVPFFEASSESIVAPPTPELSRDVESLVQQALDSRPDLQAAAFAVDAAERRARLSRYNWFRLVGILPDANGQGEKGFEAGPGMLVTVPIFHQNQGAIARAAAELERAQRQANTLRDTIVLEVRQAHARFRQAEADLAIWNDQVLPLAQRAVETADRAYRDGGASLFLVLDTSRQLLSSRGRQLEVTADLRRAAAELERSVGRRVLAESAAPAVEVLPDGV